MSAKNYLGWKMLLNYLLRVIVQVPLALIFPFWTGIPSERRFADPFPQGENVAQKTVQKQVWPIEITNLK